jgi:hypothetical protein
MCVSGCATGLLSEISIVELNIPPQPDVVIEIMPIVTAGEQYSTTFSYRTYSFNNSDYYNLRQSLKTSLDSAKIFREVREVVDQKEATDGIRMHIEFSESGMKRPLPGFSVVCVLKGKAWTTDAHNNIIAQKDINVEESNLNVGASKTEAIRVCVQEILSLLSMGKTQ